jgi:hypothetical protein
MMQLRQSVVMAMVTDVMSMPWYLIGLAFTGA